MMRILLFGCLLFSLPTPSSAQTNERAQVDAGGLDVEFGAGWDGHADTSVPVPISFLFANYAKDSIDAELFLTDPNTDNEVRLGEIFLSPGASRRFSTIRDMVNWYQCFAELRVDGEVIWRRQLVINAGQNFQEDVTFALVVNDSQKRLALPELGKERPTSGSISWHEVPPVTGPEGRPIRCLQMKTWQVPNHAGPLIPAQAVIFPEGSNADDLNQIQWQAVADWVCQGGVVFVHSDSKVIFDKLLQASALTAEPAFQQAVFGISRIGLGAIYEYTDDLLSADVGPLHQAMARVIGQLPEAHLNSIIDSSNVYPDSAGNADWNRMMVVAFFLLYTLFAGGISLLLFRQSRRRVGIYITSVVAGATVLAAVLGGILRNSQGDITWLSVTKAQSGGVVQSARIAVQSGGARSTEVAVTGNHADLQFIRTNRNYYSWNVQTQPMRPFSWQPSLSEADDRYQIRVPMTPWGRRHLHATAMDPTIRPMDLRLDFERRRKRLTSKPDGEFRLRVTNNTPWALTECLFVIGVAEAVPTMESDAVAGDEEKLVMTYPGPTYYIHRMSPLAPTESVDESFSPSFKPHSNQWDFQQGWPGGSVHLPMLTRSGSRFGFLIGRLQVSPILKFDQQQTDFKPLKEVHLFMQEIRAEDFPDLGMRQPE